MAIQDLVNDLISALPSVITKGLDTLIINENMDPWENAYSATSDCKGTWICSYDFSATVTLIKVEHLSKLYVKDLDQIGDIVDNGDGTYTVVFATKVKINDEWLNVNASTPIDMEICGAKVGPITPKDEMKISDLTATANMTCVINLAEATLVSATMDKFSTTYNGDNSQNNISGLGAFDWLMDPIADCFTNWFKGWINAELDPTLENEMNKELASITPYKIV
jgi:hypothetical protein